MHRIKSVDGQEEPFPNQLEQQGLGIGPASSWNREMTSPANTKLNLRECSTKHHLLVSYFASEDCHHISVSHQILLPTLASWSPPTLQNKLPALMKCMNKSTKINCSESSG